MEKTIDINKHFYRVFELAEQKIDGCPNRNAAFKDLESLRICRDAIKSRDPIAEQGGVIESNDPCDYCAAINTRNIPSKCVTLTQEGICKGGGYSDFRGRRLSAIAKQGGDRYKIALEVWEEYRNTLKNGDIMTAFGLGNYCKRRLSAHGRDT